MYRTDSLIDDRQISEVFAQRGFSAPIKREFGIYTALLFPKMLHAKKIVLDSGEARLILCGTMIYRGRTVMESAEQLLKDFIDGCLTEAELLGHFTCIIANKGKITLLTDKLASLAIYYHNTLPVISSSFLAIAEICDTPVQVSKQAVLEIILAHGVVPPDTQCEEIKRYIPSQKLTNFLSLEVYEYKQDFVPDKPYFTFQDAVDAQVSKLDAYFELVKPAMLETGVMTGLSGGFDSRLLLGMLLRHGLSPVAYTHWQHGISSDFLLAHELADCKKLDLIYLQEHERRVVDGDDTLLSGYLFTDAQCRNQYYWSEIYNSQKYYTLLNAGVGMGLNGVGGEQYRNHEGIGRGRISLRSWLRNEVYPFASVVLPRHDFFDFEERFVEKVKAVIGHDDKIDAIGIKKYYNLAFGYANRYYRATFENQVINHLSPFCDPFVSLYAYKAIPFLGKLYGFQIAMIRKISPELAKINSSYGFPFSENTPALYRLKMAVRNNLPRRWIRKSKQLPGGKLRGEMKVTVGERLQSMMTGLDLRKIPVTFESTQMLAELNYFTERMARDIK